MASAELKMRRWSDAKLTKERAFMEAGAYQLNGQFDGPEAEAWCLALVGEINRRAEQSA